MLEIPSHSLFSRSFTGARNNIHGLHAVHKKRISYRAHGGKPLRVEHDEKRGGDSSGNRDCTVMSYECHSAGMNTGCLLDALQEAFQIELEKTHRCPVCLAKLWPPTSTTLVLTFRPRVRGRARPGRIAHNSGLGSSKFLFRNRIMSGK